MKVVLTLLVRNEIDIIKLHLDYHLSLGIDHIVITDNLSDDGTERILEKYSERPNITLIKEKADNYDQSKWVSRMAKYAQRELKADWIIHSDCDEFFVPYGWTDIHQILRQFSTSIDYLNIERFDFLPQKGVEQNRVGDMIYKKVISTNIFGKRLPPKVIHRSIPGVVVDQGNHSISYPTNLISLDCLEIEIFHYPIRSMAQFNSKIALGGQAYANNTQLPKGVGRTWRHLFEVQKQGSLQDVFNEYCIDYNTVAEKINSGEILVDSTLSKYLKSL